MRVENNPRIIFTEKEYEILDKACMILDDLVNGEYRTAFESIMDEDGAELDLLYGMFANVVDYAEEHRE